MSLYSKASVLCLLVLVSVSSTDASDTVQPFNGNQQSGGGFQGDPNVYGNNFQQRGNNNNYNSGEGWNNQQLTAEQQRQQEQMQQMRIQQQQQQIIQQQQTQRGQWQQGNALINQNPNQNPYYSGASGFSNYATTQTLSSSDRTSVTLGVTFLAMIPSAVTSFFG
jgi:hypothetical protein